MTPVCLEGGWMRPAFLLLWTTRPRPYLEPLARADDPFDCHCGHPGLAADPRCVRAIGLAAGALMGFKPSFLTNLPRCGDEPRLEANYGCLGVFGGGATTLNGQRAA